MRVCLWVNVWWVCVCSPRIAAQAIVRLVNSTKVNQAMLALTVSFSYVLPARKHTVLTLCLSCWITVSRTVDIPSIFKLHPKSSWTTSFADFLNVRLLDMRLIPFSQHQKINGITLTMFRLSNSLPILWLIVFCTWSKSGRSLWLNYRDTRRTWDTSRTCTGYWNSKVGRSIYTVPER